MRRLTKTHKSIIFFGLFFGSAYFWIPSVNYTNCLYGDDFRQIEFEGVVIKKYLDKTQHSTPIAELRTQNDSVAKIYFFGDHSGLFDRITDGDSLRKLSGTSEVLKKVNNDYERFGFADFNCDSVELENERYLFWLYDLTGIVDKKDKK